MSTSPARRKRSYGGGYYHGGYDPSTIWFQYLLCHEQKISCYFFTQGWNEKEFGQYYLYENVLHTDLHKLGHASSGTHDDLLFLALLAGAGGSHQPYHAYPSYKKRRDVSTDDSTTEEKTIPGRRIRSTPATTEDSTTVGRRRRETEKPSASTVGRRRRETVKPTTTVGRRRRRETEKPIVAYSSTTVGRRRREEKSTTTAGRRRREESTTTEDSDVVPCESAD